MCKKITFLLVVIFSGGCTVPNERPAPVIVAEGAIDIGSYSIRKGGKMNNEREYVSRYNMTIKSEEDVSESQAKVAMDRLAGEICGDLAFDVSGGVAQDFASNTLILDGQYSNRRVQTGSIVLATFGCYEN